MTLPANHRFRPVGSLVCLIGLFGGWPPAVAADCSLQATPLIFGTYNPLASASTSIMAMITVTCLAMVADQVSYEIRLSRSPASSYSQRKMRDGASVLDYQLYTGSAMTEIWGDGTGGTVVVRGSLSLTAGTARSASYTVYGRLIGNHAIFPGTYLDPVSVTLVMEAGGTGRSVIIPGSSPFRPVPR